MSLLIAWLGNTDLRAAEIQSIQEDGPILNAIKYLSFSDVHLLSDHEETRSSNYCRWLGEKFGGQIVCHYTRLTSPTSFEEIYRAADKLIAALKLEHRDETLFFHLSPGTPAMAAVWILLAKAKYDATLIESSREHGVKTVNIPFDLSAEFIPTDSKQADEALIRLAQGLPTESPEFTSIIHRCSSMKRVIALAHRFSLRDVPVLIQGESGTGKELFARAIHASSHRKGQIFIAVNCGAIPNDLVDAELFGYEKGSFTGATSAKAGYFEAAHGGTLFLDEIGELPLASQVRLLRVLQEKEITRVGSTKPRAIDVRVISATNRHLPEEVINGRFREDLFHRLAVGVLILPPLRERVGDISLLIDSLLSKINQEAASQPGYQHKKISVKAKNILLKYSWPGNVRELYNSILRASIWTPEEEITEQDMTEVLSIMSIKREVSILERPLEQGVSLPEIIKEVIRHYLERALTATHGNKTEAAKLLGLSSYQTLSNWLKKYNAS